MKERYTSISFFIFIFLLMSYGGRAQCTLSFTDAYNAIDPALTNCGNGVGYSLDGIPGGVDFALLQDEVTIFWDTDANFDPFAGEGTVGVPPSQSNDCNMALYYVKFVIDNVPSLSGTTCATAQVVSDAIEWYALPSMANTGSFDAGDCTSPPRFVPSSDCDPNNSPIATLVTTPDPYANGSLAEGDSGTLDYEITISTDLNTAIPTACLTLNNFYTTNYSCTGCSITIDDIQAGGCDASNNFFVSIAYSTAGLDAPERFTVTDQNGNISGNFEYGEGVSIGPLSGDGATTYSFTLTDDNNTSCTVNTEEITAPICNLRTCNIVVNGVSISSCDENDQFMITFDYTAETLTTSTEFMITDQNNVTYGPFTYGQSVEVGPFDGDGITEYVFTLADTNDETCITVTNAVTGPTCPIVACDIAIDGLVAQACDENGQFMVELGYTANTNTTSFTITDQNNANLGSFNYGETVLIGPFDGNGATVYTFTITDDDDSNCTAVSPILRAPDCEAQSCSLIIDSTTPSACNENDEFTVSFGYTISNGSNSFTITVSEAGTTNVVGTYTFNYGDAVEIGPFQGDNGMAGICIYF